MRSGSTTPRRALDPTAVLVLLVATTGACTLDERQLAYGSDARDTEPEDARDLAPEDVHDFTPPPAWTNIDLLFVVDDSGSMSQEQAALATALPNFFDALFDSAATRGVDANVNVGVVATDMGTRGYAVSTCSDPIAGHDGCLQNTPSPSLTDCDPVPPSFLNRQLSYGDLYPIDALAHDFACIATLGTAGCGFEQQLEAGRKALIDNTAPGGCTSGLVRENSVIGLIFVTDEDDCSVRASHPEMFDQERTDLGHLNIRCFLHGDFLSTVEEYVAALRGLEGEGHRLVVGALVGVPLDEPACTGFGDSLDGCLDVPAMEQSIDPAQPTQLVPSCNTSMGMAFPPTRFVRLAQTLGATAYVASICSPDYQPALVAIAWQIVDQL